MGFFVYYILLLLFLLSAVIVRATSSVLINEVVVHPSSNASEWVELFNPHHVSVSEYWLDDDTDFVSDSGNSTKKSLSALLADETYPVLDVNAVFNNGGDVVVLFDKNGTIIDAYEYAQDPGENIALGRFPDGAGPIQPLVVMSRGVVNSGLLPSPTFTPEPTEVPTKAPVPTKTPVSPKVTKSVATEDEEMSATKKALPTASKKLATIKRDPLATLSGLPTSVLIASNSVKKKTTPSPTTLAVKDAAFTGTGLAFAVGGVFILSCGILLYLRKRRSDYE